jgi:hypothetical protein
MELSNRLKDADYDGALALCTANKLENLLNKGTQLDRLRSACMVADVFDYAGRYEEAKHVIENAGKAAEARLMSIHSFVDIGEPQYVKQECWALLMWGSVFL